MLLGSPAPVSHGCMLFGPLLMVESGVQDCLQVVSVAQLA